MVGITYTRNSEGKFDKTGELPPGTKDVQLVSNDGSPFGSYTVEQATELIETAIAKGQVARSNVMRIVPITSAKPKWIKEPKPPKEPKVHVPKYDVEQFKTIFLANADKKTKEVIALITAATGASDCFIRNTLKKQGLLAAKVEPATTVAA